LVCVQPGIDCSSWQAGSLPSQSGFQRSREGIQTPNKSVRLLRGGRPRPLVAALQVMLARCLPEGSDA